MFGSIRSTINKVFFGIAASVLMHLILNQLAYTSEYVYGSILFLWLGMILPDLDVLTGIIKTVFKIGAGMIILFIALFLFMTPMSAEVGGYMLDVVGLEAGTFVQQALAICIFAIISYFLANLVFGFLPSKNAFHSYIVLILFVFGVWMFSEKSVLKTAGFALGYLGHIMLDSLEKKKDEKRL